MTQIQVYKKMVSLTLMLQTKFLTLFISVLYKIHRPGKESDFTITQIRGFKLTKKQCETVSLTPDVCVTHQVSHTFHCIFICYFILNHGFKLIAKAKQLRNSCFQYVQCGPHLTFIKTILVWSTCITYNKTVVNEMAVLGKQCLRSHTNHGGQRTLNGLFPPTKVSNNAPCYEAISINNIGLG